MALGHHHHHRHHQPPFKFLKYYSVKWLLCRGIVRKSITRRECDGNATGMAGIYFRIARFRIIGIDWIDNLNWQFELTIGGWFMDPVRLQRSFSIDLSWRLWFASGPLGGAGVWPPHRRVPIHRTQKKKKKKIHGRWRRQWPPWLGPDLFSRNHVYEYKNESSESIKSVNSSWSRASSTDLSPIWAIAIGATTEAYKGQNPKEDIQIDRGRFKPKISNQHPNEIGTRTGRWMKRMMASTDR